MNVGVKFPAKISRGFLYLLCEHGSSPNFHLLSGRFEIRYACSQLLANAMDGLLQNELIQADDRQRRVTIVQPNSVARGHFADQALTVNVSHSSSPHAKGRRCNCSNRSLWTIWSRDRCASINSGDWIASPKVSFFSRMRRIVSPYVSGLRWGMPTDPSTFC